MKSFDKLVQLEIDESDVLKLYMPLGPNAKRIVLHILERLAKGAKQYGDFDGQRRDWDRESAEEALDLAVYQAAKLLGLGQEPAFGPRRTIPKSSPELTDAERGVDSCPHSYIDGKKYLRYREGSGMNSRVTLVDEDGRTPDGKPWVSPAGARVRVVDCMCGFTAVGEIGRTYVVKGDQGSTRDWANLFFDVSPAVSYAVRVVPA